MSTKKLLAAATAAAFLPGLWGMAASAEVPTPIPGVQGELTASQIQEGLTQLGFQSIGMVEGEAPHYTIQAAYQGRDHTLQVDAQTGEVSIVAPPQAGEPVLDTQYVVEQLGALGYSDVAITEETDSAIHATAWRDGEAVAVVVDLASGHVIPLAQ